MIGAAKMKDRVALTDGLLDIEALVTSQNFDGQTPLSSLVLQASAGEGFGRSVAPPNPRELKSELQERHRVAMALCKAWAAVKATVLMGCCGGAGTNEKVADEIADAGPRWPEQDSTVHLDSFTYALLAKECDSLLDQLLATMKTAVGADTAEIAVASRFVRSAVRVYSILCSGEVRSDGGVKSSTGTIKREQREHRITQVKGVGVLPEQSILLDFFFFFLLFFLHQVGRAARGAAIIISTRTATMTTMLRGVSAAGPSSPSSRRWLSKVISTEAQQM